MWIKGEVMGSKVDHWRQLKPIMDKLRSGGGLSASEYDALISCIATGISQKDLISVGAISPDSLYQINKRRRMDREAREAAVDNN